MMSQLAAAAAPRWSSQRRGAELWRRLVEASFERGFARGSGVVELRPALRQLPLLVQCAVRVHDKREPKGARVLGLDAAPRAHGAPPPLVVVAPAQRLVLLFSPHGVLLAAGQLEPGPTGPVAPGARWTRICWAASLDARDWY